MAEQRDSTGRFRFRTFEELVAPYQDPEQLRQLIEEDASDPELKAAFLEDLGPVGDAAPACGPSPIKPAAEPMSFEESLAINGGQGAAFTALGFPEILSSYRLRR